ncbi:putative 50s ribosomal protein [Neofusicoccum parvum UCRNP2]|uniref:Putative 50s ribosomal protein n=1 Tax=Botryosphaeria parva (strain UCR-NP2) TaxID=1287680 RepID=R1GYV6_BOTPV|nr:putative 50s ribosomal protein [Neofusicoccum parvum UCRNP2]
MPPTLPSPALTAHRLGGSTSLLPKTQCRHATLLRRPKRPYTFTQLITLSDGSTYLQRTTSPAPVYRSTKDIRNHPLWNPSSQKLMNVEEDEAGRLRAFRAKFGRGWDSEITEDPEEVRAPSLAIA